MKDKRVILRLWFNEFYYFKFQPITKSQSTSTKIIYFSDSFIILIIGIIKRVHNKIIRSFNLLTNFLKSLCFFIFGVETILIWILSSFCADTFFVTSFLFSKKNRTKLTYAKFSRVWLMTDKQNKRAPQFIIFISRSNSHLCPR